MGNHDVPKIKKKDKIKTAPQDLFHLKYDNTLFENVLPAREHLVLKYHEYNFDMMHYPPTLFNYYEYSEKTFYLHAHSHSHKTYNMANMSLGIPVYDVGVDANDFTPVSIDQLLERIETWSNPESIKCDKCGHSMVVRNGTYGRFVGCSNYPICKNIYRSIKLND